VVFTEQAGAKVFFDVPTLNPATADVNVVCVPSSGSMFPVGTNIVVCGVKDDLGATNQCSFTVAVLGTRGIKLDVLNQMIELRPLVAGRSGSRLDSAIRHLNLSSSTNLWEGEAHLKTRSGGRVFREEAFTVNLVRLLLSNDLQGVPAELLQLWILRLIEADRILAVVELQDAIAAGASSKQLESAIKNLLKGDSAARAQRYQKAIRYYQNAWMAAARRTDLLLRPK